MVCTECGLQPPRGAVYCPRCGARLAVSCPACGAECAADFTFCAACGTRLGAASSSGHSVERRISPAAAPASQPSAVGADGSRPAARLDERRPVTVLFADVSGFTALSERLGPEAMRELQNDLFGQLAAVVHRFDGFVEKFVGDQVMAVFGAPEAHEDDPERALRAGLAMHNEMNALNGRWAERTGIALDLHVGVNTGPVVAGTLGAGTDGAYAVTGDTVNTASRLLNAAGPAETLAGPMTHQLTRHAFAFEAVGGLQLKGKARPLAAYRLLSALERPAPARGLAAHGLATPLVGRDTDVDQLVRAFHLAAGGRSQIVAVVGEAGAGKTRLIGALLDRLQADRNLDGVSVRQTACSALGQQTYGIIGAFFRQAFDVAPDETLESSRQKVTAGLQALGGDDDEVRLLRSLTGHILGLGQQDQQAGDATGDAAPSIEPEQLKRHLLLATRTLVERRVARDPLILIVEDLQWADAASLEVLRYVADRLSEGRLLLLVTHRPAAGASPLAATRAAYMALRLQPLTAAESGSLLDAYFGGTAPLPLVLRDQVVARAGGNPFHLEEVVRALIDGGTLVRTPAGWLCQESGAAMEVPPTVQGLLLARLDRLPASARRLAQEAAVLGTTFDGALLRATATDLEPLRPLLDQLVNAEILHEVSPDRYRFVQTLLQDVAYDSLVERRRTELHGRAARALEALRAVAPNGAPDRLEDLEALGRHYRHSDDAPRAARHFAAAGDWARAIYANEDAARCYRRALEALDVCDAPACDEHRLTVRESLGDVLGPSGQRDEALQHYRTALDERDAAGDRPAQARLHRKIGRLLWVAGQRDHARAEWQAGLDLLDNQPDHIELAHLCQEMAGMAFRSGENDEALRWAEWTLALAERLAAASGDAPGARYEAATAIAHAQNTIGVSLARLGRLEEAVDRIERSAAVAQQHDLLGAACRAQTNLGVLYSTLDPGKAITTCLSGLELARRIDDLSLQSWLYANLAGAYCTFTGQCEEEGIGAAQRSIDLDRKLGLLDHLAVPLVVLGQIYQCHGDIDQATQCFHEALDLAESIGEPQLLFPCYEGLGTAYLEVGDQDKARDYLQKAKALCASAGVDADSLLVLPFLC